MISQPMPTAEDELEDPFLVAEDPVREQPPQPLAKKRKGKKVKKIYKWDKEVDISHPPRPQYQHTPPEAIMEPFDYFSLFFTMDLFEHIKFQTNLYIRQRDVNSKITVTLEDLMIFIGVVIYMGIVTCPAIVDYWSADARIPQVADFMSRNKFRNIRANLHFSDNTQADDTQDRFFKVRPLFDFITKEFLKVPETPVQSIDEVMIAYKGTMAGSLRQCIPTKPDRWGYKLICRSSVDGFIHDILMYQGLSTFVAHPVKLSEAENELTVTSRFVLALAKTVKSLKTTTLYADNYFSSIELVEFLRDQYGCRYVGTAREDRMGYPPLDKSISWKPKSVKRGRMDFASTEGILVVRWKDNSVVTMISSDVGVYPLTLVSRYDRETKKRVETSCPKVIEKYNARMGGIDKSDMLTHLYKTPYKARRYYMRIFAYVLDLCICNAWLLYKRDCTSLNSTPMSLKNFRLKISSRLRTWTQPETRLTRAALMPRDIVLPKRGQRTVVPSVEQRQDATLLHMPQFTKKRQTCKHCSSAGNIHRSRWMCEVCNVALCLSDTRNCYTPFHKNQ